MVTIGRLDALSDTISAFVADGKTIGFVPTMGALHEGHLSLIQKSIQQNEITVVSIFVNPLQFNNSKDLERYPRVLEEDLKLLEAQNIDLVFTPTVEEFYASKPMVSIDFGKLANSLEGEYRSGHFEGVGVVVSKLLHLTNPTRAYFGLKDLQQFLLVRRMCHDLNFPCQIVGVETVRENSGLALSSRNRMLSELGKNTAAIIFQGLEIIRRGILNSESLSQLLEEARKLYTETNDFELEYLEAVDTQSLAKVDSYSDLDELAVCVAGYVEGVRLIDNLYLRLK